MIESINYKVSQLKNWLTFMLRINVVILSICFVMLHLGCSSRTELVSMPDVKIIDGLSSSGDSLLDSKAVFSGIDVIALQSDEHILMANCNRVAQDLDGGYFVLDSKFASLMKFDEDGEFLFKVGNLGRGPGEFQGIDDFAIDFAKGEIIVYSSEDMRLFIFDLKGSFLRSTKLDFYSSYFHLMKGGKYGFYINYNRSDISGLYNVLITNRNGKVEDKLMPFPSSVKTAIGFSGFFQSFGDVSLYNDAFSDTVKLLNGNLNVEELLVYDFKGTQWNYGLDFNKLSQPGSIDLSFIGTRVYLDDRFLFSSFMYKRRMRSMIYDKNSNFVYNEFKMSDDLLFRILKTPQTKRADGKYLTSLTAQSYQALIKVYPDEWLNFKARYPDLEEKLSSIRDNDNNPVLIAYEIKK